MKTSFEAMNEILKGEHMAITQYQTYVDTLADGPLRNHLAAILTDHKDHATRIAYYIQTNGGKADEGSGLAGIMADWKTRLGNVKGVEPIDILDKLYDGEDKGLARAVQYSEDYLNSSEKEVLEPIFANEHDHLKLLENLRNGLFSNI